MSKSTKLVCDYCGGKEIPFNGNTNEIGLQLTSYTKVLQSCLDCWIKVFDTVLGKPVKEQPFEPWDGK